MSNWSKDVYSSMVQTVGYNDEKQELTVSWAKGGKTSIYSGVPEDVAVRLANTESVGSMMHTEIMPNYAHRYA